MTPFALILAPAFAYQLLALWACFRHLTRREPPPPVHRPPVSILKPVRGADAGFWDAIRSHALIDYPDFEIIFGLRSPDDPARHHIERLRREFPNRTIRIEECRTEAPNGKVGTLIDLATAARHPFLVVNDSDISVPPDYLDRLLASFGNSTTGLVTCLYRASATEFPARLEALGIATDFAPSALVAPTVGVREFGLGSTLALRADTLRRIGGFEAIRDYIADDYQLGKHVAALGLRVELSSMPVSTHIGGDWSSVWNHQVRWARTIRLSQGGYYGLPITNATMWSALALLFGHLWLAAALLAIRLAVGLTAGILVLRDPLTARLWWLMPLRDLFGFAVWIAGATGSTVLWRGLHLRLDRSGRIL